MLTKPLCRLLLACLAAAVLPLAVQAQEWRRSCEIVAEDRGFRIARTGEVRPVLSNERIVGYIVPVVLERGRDVVRAECDYSLRTARATLIGLDDRRRDDERARRDDERGRAPSEARTEAACVRAAERRDFRVTRLVASSALTNDRRREVAREHLFNASRERRDWRVRCIYDFRTGETDIDFYRR